MLQCRGVSQGQDFLRHQLVGGNTFGVISDKQAEREHPQGIVPPCVEALLRLTDKVLPPLPPSDLGLLLPAQRTVKVQPQGEIPVELPQGVHAVQTVQLCNELNHIPAIMAAEAVPASVSGEQLQARCPLPVKRTTDESRPVRGEAVKLCDPSSGNPLLDRIKGICEVLRGAECCGIMAVRSLALHRIVAPHPCRRRVRTTAAVFICQQLLHPPPSGPPNAGTKPGR